MFLPGACRKWKRQAELWLPNPDWVNAEYSIQFAGNDEFISALSRYLPYKEDWMKKRLSKIYNPAA